MGLVIKLKNENIEDKTINVGDVKSTILDVQVNNAIMKDFLNAINKTNDYRLSINEQGLTFENIADNHTHVIQKTVLLKSGCKHYRVDNPICAEIPLKKVKDFLRCAKRQDTVKITHNHTDKLLVWIVNTLSYKIHYTDVQEIAGNRGISPVNDDLEHTEDIPDTPTIEREREMNRAKLLLDNLVLSEKGFLTTKKYRCKRCYGKHFLVLEDNIKWEYEGQKGFRYCPVCYNKIKEGV